MFVVETYVRTTEGAFVPLSAEAPHPATLDALEGALEIALDGDELIGTRNWDDLVPLWAYLARALSNFREVGEGSFLFPDQPVELTLTRVGSDARLSVLGDGADRSLTVGGAEFLQAVCARGREFFDTVLLWYPQDAEAIDGGRNRLLQGGSGLAEVPWRRRLASKQAAVLDHVERIAGQQMRPDEREGVINAIAGRRASFDESVERVMTQWRS